jgi:AcrR family transcriptional regulator
LTRAKVFDAAISCLHENGYASASVLAVAKRAGISRGALVKQFPTKANLYAALVEHLLDEMREETLSYVKQFPPGLPRTLARLDHVWELYKKPKAFAMLEVMLGARGDSELSESLSEVGRSRQKIEKLFLGIEFDDMGIRDRRTAGLAVIQMVAAVRGLALERLLNKGSASLEEAFALQKKQTEALLRSLMTAG